MYYLYHIKGKKWGCTTRLEERLKEQGYSVSDLDRLITVGNKDKAADMEKQLNIEYGYGWNKAQDYRNMELMKGGLVYSEKRNKQASITGKKTGPTNVKKMLEKRPSTKGEGNSRATITEDIVLSIRKDYDTSDYKYGLISKLSTKYNLTYTIVNKVCKRQTWNHLP